MPRRWPRSSSNGSCRSSSETILRVPPISERSDPLSRAHILLVGNGDLAPRVLDALVAAGLATVTRASPGNDSAASGTAFVPGRTFDLLLDVDLVVEVSERTATRYLANDAAAVRGI